MTIAVEILAFLIFLAGAVIVLSAKVIVKKYKLDDKAVCDFEGELTYDELKQYKFNKALISVKMKGMFVALPGIAMILLRYN